MLSLLDLQTHGNRFERRHALCQKLWGQSQIQGGSGTGQRALYRCFIAEGQ